MVSDRRSPKMLLSLWQALVMTGILGGLIWAMTRPNWILYAPQQVSIEGNNLLPRQTILSLLPLDYPKWMLQISPDAIVRTLESYPPIADVTVSRQLFPTSLVVQVEERVPVAIARATSDTAPHSTTSIGYLDRDGVLIPHDSYPPEARRFLKPPTLKVIGKPESYRSYWRELYQAIDRASVKIVEIDCQDPNNLILKTELGIVHLGSYTSQLTEQLKVLAQMRQQMRQLTKQIDPAQIAYIDLKNPATPLVQMNQVERRLDLQNSAIN